MVSKTPITAYAVQAFYDDFWFRHRPVIPASLWGVKLAIYLNGSIPILNTKLFITCNIKTQTNLALFCFVADWSVRAILKISAFEGVFKLAVHLRTSEASMNQNLFSSTFS